MFWRKKKKPEADTNKAVPIKGSIKVVVKTDLGNIRTNNEDSAASFRIDAENTAFSYDYLFIVADGMGGHLAGEVASKLAVDNTSNEYLERINENDKEKILENAFRIANKKIFELATTNKNYQGMGTTCTALAVVDQDVYYAHAGDSRAYMLKKNSLVRITEDHTYVQQLVNTGEITSTAADTHPQRNILTNAMGTKPTLRVDTGKFYMPLEPGDRLMICSDGLYDYLSDADIATAMSNYTLGDLGDYFIAEAKKRGGADNITVVLAEAEATAKETELKSTREVGIPKLTRDADLPVNIEEQ